MTTFTAYTVVEVSNNNITPLASFTDIEKAMECKSEHVDNMPEDSEAEIMVLSQPMNVEG